MKRIATLLILLISFSLSAQKLISHIESEGNLQKYFLTDVEDVPYILTFDALDSIRVFTMQEEGQTLMSKHYMIGSYNQFYYRVFGKWLLLEGVKDAFAINLLTGEEKVFITEDDYTFNRWISYDKNVVLRQSLPDFSDKIYQLMDEELQIIDVDDWYGDVRKISDEYAIVEKQENGERIFYRADITTHELWEVARFVEGEYYVISDSQIFAYRNDNVEIINVVDGTTEDLYSITFEPVRTYVNNLENFFIFTAFNLDDEEVTVVYSKTSNIVKIWPFLVDNYIYKSPPNKFIFEDPMEYDTAHIYDFETEVMVNFPTLSVDESVIVADRYLINRVWFDFHIYDIDLNSSSIATGEYTWVPNRNWEVIKKGNKALIYIETIDERLNELTALDLSTSHFSSPDLPSVERGLNNHTQLFRLGEDIIVGSEEHIYQVIEDSILQLNTNTIIESSYQPFAKRGNELFWAEDQDSLVYFHSFKDGEKKIEGIFGIGNSPVSPDNFWVRQFTNGNNTILIFGLQGFESKSILLNKETGNVTNINDIPYSLINSARYNKDYFYTLSDFLYAVDETGLVQTVDIILPQLLFGGSYVFEDNLYVVGADGLYLVDGLDATKVLSHDPGIFIADFEILAGYLVYTAGGNSFIYKDGIWHDWTKLEGLYYSKFDEEYLQVVESTGTNLTETQLFHIENNEYIDLPLEIKESRLVSRFSYFDKQYIISYEGSLPTYDVKIHEVNEDFTAVDEIHSFQSVGRGLSAHFEEFGNEGFLYIGNKLFLMNEDLEFIPLEGVFGDTENVNAVEKDGYFYFIAFHPELGRQVWSVQAFSERVSVKDLKKMLIKVYPNPSDQVLFLSHENNLSKGNYKIFSTSGQEVGNGLIDSSKGIDIRQLASGFYFLKYYNEENQVFTAPFVKR